ncbi:MAG: transporter substrate-binding domain-containing protein [Halobacteriovoraceae bacterium]|nr:transporter substrate-binding domain-containing protein [Halobacteriovoraceae bacterium]
MIFFMRAQSKEKIRFVSYSIPQYVISESKGEFIDLIKKIASEIDVDIEIKIYPPRRAILAFQNGEFDAYFPGLDILNTLPFFNTVPYYFKKDYLFFRTGEEIKSISNQKICITRGYPYDQKILLKKDINFTTAESDEACIKMLKAKRVNGFLCEMITGTIAIASLGYKNISVDPTNVLSSAPVYITFSRNKKGKKYSEIFSKKISEYIENKYLEKLFRPSIDKVTKTFGPGHNPFIP